MEDTVAMEETASYNTNNVETVDFAAQASSLGWHQ
jgi:hypothetical protein